MSTKSNKIKILSNIVLKPVRNTAQTIALPPLIPLTNTRTASREMVRTKKPSNKSHANPISPMSNHKDSPSSSLGDKPQSKRKSSDHSEIESPSKKTKSNDVKSDEGSCKEPSLVFDPITGARGGVINEGNPSKNNESPGCDAGQQKYVTQNESTADQLKPQPENKNESSKSFLGPEQENQSSADKKPTETIDLTDDDMEANLNNLNKVFIQKIGTLQDALTLRNIRPTITPIQNSMLLSPIKNLPTNVVLQNANPVFQNILNSGNLNSNVSSPVILVMQKNMQNLVLLPQNAAPASTSSANLSLISSSSSAKNNVLVTDSSYTPSLIQRSKNFTSLENLLQKNPSPVKNAGTIVLPLATKPIALPLTKENDLPSSTSDIVSKSPHIPASFVQNSSKPPLNLKCYICEYRTLVKNDLILHMHTAHLQEGYQLNLKCKTCNFETAEPSVMENHDLDHIKGGKRKKKLPNVSLSDNVIIGLKKVEKTSHVGALDGGDVDAADVIAIYDSDDDLTKAGHGKLTRSDKSLIENHATTHDHGLQHSQQIAPVESHLQHLINLKFLDTKVSVEEKDAEVHNHMNEKNHIGKEKEELDGKFNKYLKKPREVNEKRTTINIVNRRFNEGGSFSAKYEEFAMHLNKQHDVDGTLNEPVNIVEKTNEKDDGKFDIPFDRHQEMDSDKTEREDEGIAKCKNAKQNVALMEKPNHPKRKGCDIDPQDFIEIVASSSDVSKTSNAPRKKSDARTDHFPCYFCSFVGNARYRLKRHLTKHFTVGFQCDKHKLVSESPSCTMCLCKDVMKDVERDLQICDCGFKTLEKAKFTRHTLNAESCNWFHNRSMRESSAADGTTAKRIRRRSTQAVNAGSTSKKKKESSQPQTRSALSDNCSLSMNREADEDTKIGSTGKDRREYFCQEEVASEDGSILNEVKSEFNEAEIESVNREGRESFQCLREATPNVRIMFNEIKSEFNEADIGSTSKSKEIREYIQYQPLELGSILKEVKSEFSEAQSESTSKEIREYIQYQRPGLGSILKEVKSEFNEAQSENASKEIREYIQYQPPELGSILKEVKREFSEAQSENASKEIREYIQYQPPELGSILKEVKSEFSEAESESTSKEIREYIQYRPSDLSPILKEVKSEFNEAQSESASKEIRECIQYQPSDLSHILKKVKSESASKEIREYIQYQPSDLSPILKEVKSEFNEAQSKSASKEIREYIQYQPSDLSPILKEVKSESASKEIREYIQYQPSDLSPILKEVKSEFNEAQSESTSKESREYLQKDTRPDIGSRSESFEVDIGSPNKEEFQYQTKETLSVNWSFSVDRKFEFDETNVGCASKETTELLQFQTIEALPHDWSISDDMKCEFNGADMGSLSHENGEIFLSRRRETLPDDWSITKNIERESDEANMDSSSQESRDFRDYEKLFHNIEIKPTETVRNFNFNEFGLLDDKSEEDEELSSCNEDSADMVDTSGAGDNVTNTDDKWEDVFKCFAKGSSEPEASARGPISFQCSQHTEAVESCSECKYELCLLGSSEIVYACSKCNYQTHRIEDYDSHVKNECGKPSPPTELNQHSALDQENSKKFKCLLCPFVANSRRNLKSHMTRHYQANFKCDIHESAPSNPTCYKCFYKTLLKEVEIGTNVCSCGYRNLSKHLLVRHQSKKENCKLFKSRIKKAAMEDDVEAEEDLQPEKGAGVIIKPANKQFKCFLCNLVSPSQSALRYHVISHSKETYQCSDHVNDSRKGCDQCFFKEMLAQNNSKILYCQNCGFRTMRKKDFLRHQRKKAFCLMYLKKHKLSEGIPVKLKSSVEKEEVDSSMDISISLFMDPDDIS